MVFASPEKLPCRSATVGTVIAAVPVIPVGASLLRSHGNYVFPMSALTEVRLVAGIAALLAVTAVLALAARTRSVTHSCPGS